MIFVTGASGTFGSHVAKDLQAKKIPFRAGAQDSQKAAAILGTGIDCISFDWNEPGTFEPALKDITKLYLVSPPNSPSFPEQVAPFLQAAKKMGVGFVVFSSVYGTDQNPGSSLYKAETAVQNAGMEYAIVRPNFIFQNFINYDLAAVRQGIIYLPSGESKTSYIDVRDVALAIVEILQNPQPHSAKAYNITGAESLSHAEMAEIFSTVLHKPVQNLDPSGADYEKTLTGYGLPAATVAFMGQLYAYIKAGYFATPTSDFTSITHRQPRSFKQFAEDYKAVFLGDN